MQIAQDVIDNLIVRIKKVVEPKEVILFGFEYPVDVIIATRADLEKHKDNPGLIYRNILEEGKTVYAA
jgi:hypothetical protein